ncbi:MAG: MFS transporter [Burkholderiales bacterium]|nr:MFS transporter [Burkholderiales bacterium]
MPTTAPPSPYALPDEDVERGKRALVRDAAWASLTGALQGGVIMVGFALALGAGPLVLGLLASIPFIGQLSQLVGVAVVERVRVRRRVAVTALGIARVAILVLALIPFLPARLQVWTLVAMQLLIAVPSSIAGCAMNSWTHQLVPRHSLGSFFSRKLFWATLIGCLGSLAAGFYVDRTPWGEGASAYAILFVVAAAAGFVSIWYVVHTPEPLMPPAVTHGFLSRMLPPFRDHGFRRLLVLMGAWNFTSNLAMPFLAVFLMQRLGYTLGTVTTLWVTSQLANALTVYLWGRLSDRFTNKAVLSGALPLFFLCLFSLIFMSSPLLAEVRLPVLFAVHLLMGIAAGGVSLATANLGLKLAPHEQGTAYLASVSLVGALAGGLAPTVGGALAEWVASVELSVLVHWVTAQAADDFTVLTFGHWEMLFALSALLGLYVMHAMSRIVETGPAAERAIIQEFVLEGLRSVNQLSSISGLTAIVSAVGRLADRRRSLRAFVVFTGRDASPRS